MHVITLRILNGNGVKAIHVVQEFRFTYLIVYEHHGRTDSHCDYTADPRVEKFDNSNFWLIDMYE